MKYKKTAEFLDRAADFFDLPSEVISGAAMVTITGERTVRIENHRGVECLESGCVIVKTGSGHIHIRGAGMTLTAMSGSELLVSGKISGIDFEE